MKININKIENTNQELRKIKLENLGGADKTTPSRYSFTIDFEDNEKSLVSLVISGQRSILLNRKDIFKMVQDGRIVAPTIFPESWIGVPILFDDSLIGVQIVQSFKKGGSYIALMLSFWNTYQNMLQPQWHEKRMIKF